MRLHKATCGDTPYPCPLCPTLPEYHFSQKPKNRMGRHCATSLISSKRFDLQKTAFPLLNQPLSTPRLGMQAELNIITGRITNYLPAKHSKNIENLFTMPFECLLVQYTKYVQNNFSMAWISSA
jgi:hypothetical protein